MTARRPSPPVLADYLTRIAAMVRANGQGVRDMADILASAGFPSSTLGNGSRGSDPTSSTERAALNPNPWADINTTLARLERQLWHTALQVETIHARILRQASDDDIVPAGTGSCTLPTCEHFCNPRKQPEDRLRRGLCPAHYQRWVRLNRPDRTTFICMLANEQEVA